MSKMPIVWISEVGFLLGIGVDRMEIYAWGTNQPWYTGN